MKKLEKVFLEIILILFSVLIFRSLWNLMDLVAFFNTTGFHLVALVLGIILSIFAFRKLLSAR
ncbi:hypothetical protein FJZ20_02185 [Candidatus Pacearchaeota archaeon]|nr:hypothetical protein [Candidatus Pacearchaeota archaeon]